MTKGAKTAVEMASTAHVSTTCVLATWWVHRAHTLWAAAGEHYIVPMIKKTGNSFLEY